MYHNMVKKDLIYLDFKVKTLEELFNEVSSILKRKGYVKSSYYDAILKRELNFPTGLMTKGLNIGLPHSDSEHIEEPFIFIARNADPLEHRQMGDNAEMKSLNFLFLGIKDSSKQVGLLSKLMELFSDEEFTNNFSIADDSEDMYLLLDNNFKKEEE